MDQFLIEVLGPILHGFFVCASTRDILWWKLAAWGWLGVAVISFSLVCWVHDAFGIGLAIGVGLFSSVASPVSSASAWVLHRRIDEKHRADGMAITTVRKWHGESSRSSSFETGLQVDQ